MRVSDVIPLDQADRQLSTALLLRIPGNAAPELLDHVKQALGRFHGDRPVFVDVHTPAGWKVTVRADSRMNVSPTPELLGELAALIGEENVRTAGPIRLPRPAARAPAPAPRPSGEAHEDVDEPDEALA